MTQTGRKIIFVSMKKLLIVLVTVLAALFASTRMEAQEGQTHPVLVVNRSGSIALVYQPFSKYVGQGKPTLLYFWGARYDECRDEAILVQQLQQKFKGLTALGVPIDGEIDATRDKMKELGLTYPQLFDMDDEPSSRYDLDGLPYTVLLNPDGTVLVQGLHGEALEKAVEGCF